MPNGYINDENDVPISERRSLWNIVLKTDKVMIKSKRFHTEI